MNGHSSHSSFGLTISFFSNLNSFLVSYSWIRQISMTSTYFLLNLHHRKYLCQSLLWPDLIFSGARRRKKSLRSMKRNPKHSARRRRNTNGYYMLALIFFLIVEHYQLTLSSVILVIGTWNEKTERINQRRNREFWWNTLKTHWKESEMYIRYIPGELVNTCKHMHGV